jgi:hypothetical protein
MRIALATCSNLPAWEVDDQPMHDALRARGAAVDLVPWDDESVDWTTYDACLIRTTWDYTERCEEFVAWAMRCGALTLLLNPAEVVQWNTNKKYLRDLEHRGVPVVETAWLDAGESADIARLMKQRNWQSGFIKPAIGASARGALRFTDSAEDINAAQRHVERLHAAGEDLLLQPYISTVETHGEFSAIWIDGTFSHGVQKIPVEGDFRTQDDYGASDRRWELTTTERDFTGQVMHHAEQLIGSKVLHNQPLLYGRVDMLRDAAGQLRLIELELVEPSLFFRGDASAAQRLADALLKRVSIRM